MERLRETGRGEKAAGPEFRINCSATFVQFGGCMVSFDSAEGLQIHVG